jgi:hypothetical protein
MRALILSFLVIFAAVFLFSACTAQKDIRANEDPLEQAYQKIDKGDYDAAISDLERLVKSDPRPETKQGLASAYAARAGLKIQNYSAFISSFKAPLITTETIKKSPIISEIKKYLDKADQQTVSRRTEELEKIVKTLASIELWFERLEKLPIISGEQRDDLERALVVLDQGDTPGLRLYRAILGLVAIRSDVAEGFTSWNTVSTRLQANQSKLCAVDLKEFALWGSAVIRRLSYTVSDVSVAFPSKKPTLLPAVAETQKISSTLSSVSEAKCLP